MKLLIATTTSLMLVCGSALAQGTGPASQGDNMTKPGMHNESGTNSMERRSTHDGTTGMSGGTSTGTVRPDPSGQGGSGAGSDQGGTRAAPTDQRRQ